MGTGGSSTTGRIFGEEQIGHGEANVSMNYRPRISGSGGSLGTKEPNFRRRGSFKALPLCQLRLDVKDRVHLGLTVLTSKFLPHFGQVNRIHDNNVVRTVFAQK